MKNNKFKEKTVHFTTINGNPIEDWICYFFCYKVNESLPQTLTSHPYIFETYRVKLWYFKLSLFILTEFIFSNIWGLQRLRDLKIRVCGKDLNSSKRSIVTIWFKWCTLYMGYPQIMSLHRVRIEYLIHLLQIFINMS